MHVEHLAQRIRDRLQDAADPAIAPGQQAYMKSAMPFYGVRVPEVRRLVRDELRAEQDAAVLTELALLLWREAEFREERYAATGVLALRPLRGRWELLPVYEEVIRTGAWWDHVDEVVHRLRELWDDNPERMAPLMRSWARDDDFWVRRASIISQLGRRDDTDRAALEDAIAQNTADREFFIRKAIGWALRDLARNDPAWVRHVADTHNLSPLSRREALKHL